MQTYGLENNGIDDDSQGFTPGAWHKQTLFFITETMFRPAYPPAFFGSIMHLHVEGNCCYGLFLQQHKEKKMYQTDVCSFSHEIVLGSFHVTRFRVSKDKTNRSPYGSDEESDQHNNLFLYKGAYYA